MKFVFKRKYTFAFIMFLILSGIAIAFYFVGPRFIDRETGFFKQVLAISLIDIFLIIAFILGLYRVNYFLYYDHLEIHRSLHKTVSLDYKKIQSFSENPDDHIIFFFGVRPSFSLQYKANKKTKKYCIRVSRHELFKKVMLNENKIHLPIANNK